MKKLLSFLLCLLMIFGSVTFVFAAGSETKGTTIRLAKTDGKVAVSNSSGNSVSFWENMKLYSGYTVSTKEKSYAYISLDKKKALKLDASTVVEVRKSGRKLEILLNEGSIFFNVSEKLTTDESMSIRTNTMITGITGTAGQVGENSIVLVSGSVEISTAGGEIVQLEKGNSIVVSTDPENFGAVEEIEPVEELTELSGFALEYIKETPALQERLEDTFTSEQISSAVEAADEILAEDEAAAEETAVGTEMSPASRIATFFAVLKPGKEDDSYPVPATEPADPPAEPSEPSGEPNDPPEEPSDPPEEPVIPPIEVNDPPEEPVIPSIESEDPVLTHTVILTGLTYGVQADYILDTGCGWGGTDGTFTFTGNRTAPGILQFYYNGARAAFEYRIAGTQAYINCETVGDKPGTYRFLIPYDQQIPEGEYSVTITIEVQKITNTEE